LLRAHTINQRGSELFLDGEHARRIRFGVEALGPQLKSICANHSGGNAHPASFYAYGPFKDDLHSELLGKGRNIRKLRTDRRDRTGRDNAYAFRLHELVDQFVGNATRVIGSKGVPRSIEERDDRDSNAGAFREDFFRLC
jgi:hypothetical protein